MYVNECERRQRKTRSGETTPIPLSFHLQCTCIIAPGCIDQIYPHLHLLHRIDG